MLMTKMQQFWMLIFIASVGLLGYLLQPVLTPFLIGFLLAYLGDPMADALEARGMGRTLAVSMVFIVLTLVLVIAVLLTMPLVGRQLDLLASKIPEWIAQLQESVIPWLQQQLNLPKDSLAIPELKTAIGENWMTAGNLLNSFWKQLAGSSMAMIAGLANLALVPVVTFYLLRDWDVLMSHINDLLPRSCQSTVVKLARECDEILGAFIRGQLLVMLALGVVYSAGLWLVGLDLALILGLIAGLASVVPYLGFIVGIIVAGISAWFQFYELAPLLLVGLVFGVGQVLEGMVLTPLMVGDRIGLHPVAVIFAIMAGGQLAGFTGVLLALPVAAVLMVVIRHGHRNYKDSAFYADNKVNE